MASDTSSAVLDLNDADVTDTDPGSVADGVHEGVPLIMEHGYDIAVKVDAPMKQLSTLETFVTYRVRCVCARWQTPPSVRRRYNHFKVLHKRLCQAHPLIAVPPLPPLHSARQQLDRYSPAFVAIRTLALDAFINRVAKHPILSYNDDFRIFLTTPDEELDKVFKSESGALNLWGLGNVLYGSSETKSTNGARVKDPEFTSASDYLQSLQQKLTTLCTFTNKLYKGTSSLSQDHADMKRLCDAWASRERGRISATASGIANASEVCSVVKRPIPRQHRATLPLLAAYCGVLTEKYKQRDALHAAYVSGASSSGELQNRLEQASEALRSDLADWTPKTRSEIKTLLLDLADRQVNMHTQILMGWDRAMKLSSETNVKEIFKTVSKTAVQNLSPSKCKPDHTLSETERDFDDIDIENDSNEDSGEISRIHDIIRNEDDEIDEVLSNLTDNKEDNGDEIVAASIKRDQDSIKQEDDEIDRVLNSLIDNREEKTPSASESEEKGIQGNKLDSDKIIDPLRNFSNINLGNSSNRHLKEVLINSDDIKNECDDIDAVLSDLVDPLNDNNQNRDDTISNTIVNKGANEISEPNCNSNVTLDPLQNFAEVDLSS